MKKFFMDFQCAHYTTPLFQAIIWKWLNFNILPSLAPSAVHRALSLSVEAAPVAKSSKN